MHWDAGCLEVVILEAANVEGLRGQLCILSKEAVLVATLYKEDGAGILSLDGDVLLL